MKINIPMMFLSTLIAALVNLLIYYTLGPVAVLIEAVPGGVVVWGFTRHLIAGAKH